MVLWNKKIDICLAMSGVKYTNWYREGRITGEFYTVRLIGVVSGSIEVEHCETLPAFHWDTNTVSACFYRSPQEWGLPNIRQRVTAYISVIEEWSGAVLRTGTSEFSVEESAAEEKHECPTGQHWDEATQTCVADTKPPPVTIEEFPPYPDSLNPLDWIKWIGQVLQWMVKQIWLSLIAVITQMIDTVWSWLPESMRQAVRNTQKLIAQIQSTLDTVQDAPAKILDSIQKFLTDPREFLLLLIISWFKEASPSVQKELVDSIEQSTEDELKEATKEGAEKPVTVAQAQAAIETQMSSLFTLLDSPLVVEEAQDKAKSLFDNVFATVLGLNVLDYVAELTMAGQDKVTAMNTSRLIGLTGIESMAAVITSQRFTHNLLPVLERAMRKRFHRGLPESPEVIRMRRLELIEQPEFEDVIAQTGGIDARWAGLLYDSSLDPPGLDDFITYNLRHPDKAWAPEKYAAIANIDVKRYLEIFNERNFIDPSVTQARFMYEVGAIDEAFVKDIIRRNRFRTELLPGQTMSDADAMTSFITGFQTRIWYRQELLALRASFMEGLATEEDLKTSASKLLTNPKAIDAYVNAAKERKKVKDKTFNILPLATLEKIVEYGASTPEYMDKQIDLMDYTDETKVILKAYLRAKIKEYLEEPEEETPVI